MLSDKRFHRIGETPYAHEAEAIEFARQALPDRDPFQLWALFELPDPSTGGLYEIDLLVMGYSALYLVEVKSGPGHYRGDAVNWWWSPPGKPSRYRRNPFPLANHKAKVLRSRLERKMKKPCPFVQALVFLSAEDVRLDLRDGGLTGVLRRDDFARAFTHHEFPGAKANWRGQRIDRPVQREIIAALPRIGVKAREGKLHVGSYELGPLLLAEEGYQERAATHRASESMKRRARTYLVPQQTTVERRQQLSRAADREANLLERVKEHPGVLSVTDYVIDAPLGPTVLFEEFEHGVPLGAFLGGDDEVSFSDRIAIVEQVGRALAHCHRKEVFHGGLCPDAVLVRRQNGAIETRLCNFQLGGGEEVTATRHRTQLAGDAGGLFQAPELRGDPGQLGRESDIFSLGALAYLIFTGHPPATSLAGLLERLARDQWLEPTASTDALTEPVADWIRLMTQLSPLGRFDDADEAMDFLLEAATEPESSEADELDPLEARRGDVMGDLEVEQILGHGATSRVLQVRRGNRAFALKVPLTDEHDERFDREAEVLAKLRHPRVVELIERVELGGRTCLLMTVAGDMTLQKHLTREGTLSVDLACRYGEDLLQALEHLEECQVLHRDIKPANLGVGAADKKRKHLTLFDFSLAFGSTSAIDVGTAPYRDPFLHERAGWDYHAERWGAAVTLHEMLTGVRPQWGDEAQPALSEGAELFLAAERFDSALRDRLLAFFERALARKVDDRFESTHAMRAAWLDVFKSVTLGDDGRTSDLPPYAALPDDELAVLDADTPIAALALTTRARNALDRAGLVRAGQILELPTNRLQAIRGVGRTVSQEIVGFRTRWEAAREAAAKRAAETPTPFFPAYRGADLMVHAASLGAELAVALHDAGLRTLGAVATAPKAQVGALCKRVQVPVKELRASLEREHERADDDGEPPETVGDWLAELLPERRKTTRYFLSLFGLDKAFAGRLDVTVKEVAAHHGVTQPAVYVPYGKLRTAWRERSDFEPIRQACRELVQAAGGALPLERTGLQLRVHLGDDLGDRDPLVRAEGAALVRIAVECEGDEGLQLVRLRDDAPWILSDPALLTVVRRLGDVADELAARPVLVTPGEVARQLREETAGTPLAQLDDERLTELAAAASKTAARSARLELYPRGMPATRALELCASVLGNKVIPLVVQTRVASRYPEAEPLPERPALDELLRPYGLRFVDEEYRRIGSDVATSHSTTFSSWTTGPTSLSSKVPRLSSKEMARRDFDEELRDAIERASLRLLAVDATRAEAAALQLAERFDLKLASIDALLLAAMRTHMEALGVEPWAVHDADREGPAGDAWGNLTDLMRAAADTVASELFPPREPLLLVSPGLLARYHLDAFLERLVAASKEDGAAAIFLLLPMLGADRALPTINGELAIPGVLPSQTVEIPKAWLARSTAA